MSDILFKNRVSEKPLDVLNIVYYSAGGLIEDRQPLYAIVNSLPDNSDASIILVGDGSDDSLTRLQGLLKDLMGGLEWEQKEVNINFTITNDSCMQENSIVIQNKYRKNKINCSCFEVDSTYFLPKELKIELNKNLELKQNITENIVQSKKITYIGATGKIGQLALSLIVEKLPKNQNLTIVLPVSDSAKSVEKLKELISRFKDYKNVNFIISKDYKETSNSDFVICSMGKFPTMKEMEEELKKDNSARNIQSVFNFKIIKEIFAKLNIYCPKTTTLMLTNQVDTMSQLAREVAPNMLVVGLGCMVDVVRFRQNIRAVTGLLSDALMIGYHHIGMIPFLQHAPKMSNGKLLTQEEINEIVKKTSVMGGDISWGQRVGLDQNKDTGASILPATAIAKFIKDYCFGVGSHYGSYNLLLNKEIANIYGLPENAALSIIVKISKDKIEPQKIVISKDIKNNLISTYKEMCDIRKQLD